MPKTDVDGLRKKFRKVARFSFGIKDMMKFGNIVRTVRMKAFDASIAPDGSQWEKLKPETIARKRKKGAKHPTKPLIDVGYLRKPTVEAEENMAVVRVAKSREAISGYHNAPTGDRPPKREHWAIYPEAIKQIEKLKEQIFERVIRSIFG